MIENEKIEMKIKKLQYIIDFLYTHNKNYTKKQLVEEENAEK